MIFVNVRAGVGGSYKINRQELGQLLGDLGNY